jgi:hypothetical protein
VTAEGLTAIPLERRIEILNELRATYVAALKDYRIHRDRIAALQAEADQLQTALHLARTDYDRADEYLIELLAGEK